MPPGLPSCSNHGNYSWYSQAASGIHRQTPETWQKNKLSEWTVRKGKNANDVWCISALTWISFFLTGGVQSDVVEARGAMRRDPGSGGRTQKHSLPIDWIKQILQPSLCYWAEEIVLHHRGAEFVNFPVLHVEYFSSGTRCVAVATVLFSETLAPVILQHFWRTFWETLLLGRSEFFRLHLFTLVETQTGLRGHIHATFWKTVHFWFAYIGPEILE